MLAEEDIEDLAAELAPNSSAAILLFEHVWATRFRDAVVDSGGELVASIRIPKEAIDEVLAGQLSPAPPESTEIPEHPNTRGSPMLRRGRPIMRTAAIVGTASVVGGASPTTSSRSTPPRTRRPRPREPQYAEPAVRAAASAAAPRRGRPTEELTKLAQLHSPGHPHRRGVLGQEGADPRHLSRPGRAPSSAVRGRGEAKRDPRAARRGHGCRRGLLVRGSGPSASSTPPAPRRGGEVVVGTYGEVDGFNPLKNQWSGPGYQIARSVLDPLVVMDRDSHWQPYLAKSITPERRLHGVDLRAAARDHVPQRRGARRRGPRPVPRGRDDAARCRPRGSPRSRSSPPPAP